MSNLIIADATKLNDLELENAVLGALIIEPNRYEEVATLLKPEIFYSPANAIIYKCIAELSANDKPIDILTLSAYIESKGLLEKIGGRYYISTLITKVASAAHIEYHARVLMDLAYRRNAYFGGINISKNAVDVTYDLDKLTNDISEFIEAIVASVYQTESIKSLKDLLLQYTQNIEEKKEKNQLKPSIESVRRLVSAWRKGELIIVAGRPGMGKTAFTLFEMVQQAKMGHAVLFFSLEMSSEDLRERIIAMESDIDVQRIERYDLSSDDWERLDHSFAVLERTNIYIDDQPHMDINYIITQAKISVKKLKVEAICIDYLQLIAMTTAETRALAVAECTRRLKILARSLDIPIFLICQLNRDVQSRQSSGYEPMLSDLKESGAIEQDADQVLFVFRFSYYFPLDPRGFNRGYIKIAKNRKGAVGNASVQISTDVTRWSHRESTGEDEIFGKK